MAGAELAQDVWHAPAGRFGREKQIVGDVPAAAARASSRRTSSSHPASPKPPADVVGQ